MSTPGYWIEKDVPIVVCKGGTEEEIINTYTTKRLGFLESSLVIDEIDPGDVFMTFMRKHKGDIWYMKVRSEDVEFH